MTEPPSGTVTLSLAERRADAAAALEQAAELFEQKGNTTSLEQVRRRARPAGRS
jgi:hypothetical protein